MTTRKGKEAAAEEGLPNFQTAGEEGARAPLRAGDLLGKHRLSASIARLQKEIESLQGELEELDTLGPSSTSCEEVLLGVESIPDGLIPTTKGGTDNMAWDRWFQPVRGSHHRRARSSSSHRWWTRKVSEF